MSYPEPFPSSATLEGLQNTLIAYQEAQTANLVSLRKANAEFADGTESNCNIAEFEPQDHKYQVYKSLLLVKKADAAADFIKQKKKEGWERLGDDAKNTEIYVKDNPEAIVVFYKKP